MKQFLIFAAVFMALAAQDSLAKAQTKPNFVMIVLDDGDAESMDLGLTQTKALVADQGVILPNFVTNTPVCGPSRAIMLRGQYAHNTKILENADSAKFYGWAYKNKKLVSQATIERDTIATRLQAGGYRTGHFGKYLNGWGSSNITGPTPPPPPGWNKFIATVVQGKTPTTFTQYRLLNGNALTIFGPESNPSLVYEPRMVTQHAISFIRSTPANKPLFAMVHMRPPHEPATPHPSMANEPLPAFVDAPSFGDPPEPPVQRALTSIGFYPFTQEWMDFIDTNKANRYRSLRYVDQLIMQIVNELQSTGRLDNTFIFVLSDNGWHEGEHSIPAIKGTAYKESISPPMWVRGPNMPAGRIEARLAGTHDLAPTLLGLAGIQIPQWMDGRQLRPLLFGNTTTTWRTAILGEHWQVYKWSALVAQYWKLVEWTSGELELYDTAHDPYERTNLAHQPGYEARVSQLKRRLTALKTCAGAVQCKAAEGQ